MMHICNCGLLVDGEVIVRGRKVRFEFNRMMGPVVLDRYGEPKQRQPISEKDPFWPPFNAWLAQHNKDHKA